MTRGSGTRWLLAAGVALLLGVPSTAAAQEAALTGTITDATGGVLPGVTVTAVHEATGNRFVAVTDERGIYRIPARVGAYQITAELLGFTTVTRSGVQLLVGQTATVDLQMAVSTVQETVTVSAETPLLNVTTSVIGGNIDPQQVQELPVQGRNWMALAMLAPGSRMTSDTATTPMPERGQAGDVRQFQFNIDGQQVTSEKGFGTQPRYSQESIAEFQFISNRFDATLGRSSGVQVLAVTRSGTNMFAGSVRGNFRDSRFNARDPVIGRVVPIDNQQIAGTLGGPIRRDRLHFFGHYEYEREPRTSVWNTPYSRFNVERTGTRTLKMGGVRLDYQLSTNVRLMGKVSDTRGWSPFQPGNTSHPAGTQSQADRNREYLGQLTQVLSNRAVNEIKVGFKHFIFEQRNLTTWTRHWQAPFGNTNGSPRIQFTGFGILGGPFLPQDGAEDTFSIRNDFTFSYEARGRHDLRAGGDYLRIRDYNYSCRFCRGHIDARGGPIPANIQDLFPDPWNADTWNLAAISPLVRTYDVGVGNFNLDDIRPNFGVWLQDDWRISSTLTLNLGVRYDLALNANGNEYTLPPLVMPGRTDDKNNVQPRVGFAYQLNDRTVLRGGSGLYFAAPTGVELHWMAHNALNATIQFTNDGRPNFAADPLNGQPLPTLEQARERFCHVRNVPGCLRLTVGELSVPSLNQHLGRTWQNSLGVARQLGAAMAFEADYVYSQGRNEKDIIGNTNLTFNPATGANYPFSDISRRAFPEFGVIQMQAHTGWSSYHALQTVFTKRLSNRWQASGTYTLSGFWDAYPPPISGIEPVPFPVAPDLGGEFTLSKNDVRHRAVFNGIWQVGRGFQASAVFLLMAGERSATDYGGDLRQSGGAGEARLRPNGTIVPRNSITQPARRRFDLRLQQRFPLGGRVALDGIAEIFNLFNSPNWTIAAQESSPQYGRRIAGQNRTAQVGFRLTF
ncbi:MAG: TonB-dependent receptor [Acidobacteria bacterium]|nr:TonB-dependent receptor [Acidobacteriota bacterium]